MLFNLSQKNSDFPTTKAKYRKTSVKILLELLLLSNIYPLKLMDQSTEMWAVMNRLIELTGWIVLVVSVILLGVASHIDNYQPPEQSTTVQHK